MRSTNSVICFTFSLLFFAGGRVSAQVVPSFTQRGSGAVLRSMQDKLEDFVNVKDFGAKCDGGKTDDRAAIQAAIDAVGEGTLYLPYPGCGVSSPGIFLYPLNGGITITGLGQIPPGVYEAGSGGGLMAYSPSPPETLLTIFAASAKVRNLYLDCNNGASKHGILSAMGMFNTWTDVATRRCSGDGGELFDEGTPVTHLTQNAIAGGKSITVTAVTNNRLTFGAYYCPYIALDFGKANAEYTAAVSGVSGNIVSLSAGLKKDHALGSTAQCHGNSNVMHIDRYSSYANDGWGWNVLPGPDNNGLYWADGSSNGNKLGGESWSGSVHVHIGGHYEGDNGPALQLGNVTGATTHFMAVGPAGDMEEASKDYNAVVSVCDDSSQVQVQVQARLSIMKGPKSCPAYPAGSTTTGFGTDNQIEWFVKNAAGTVTVRPGPVGSVNFYDAEGALLNTIGITDSGGIGSGKPISDFAHSQLEANGGSSGQGACANCKTMMGYRTDLHEGFIQATIYGSSVSPLALNPAGGAVLLGPAGGITASALPQKCLGGEVRYINDASAPTFGAVATGTGTAHPGGYRLVQCNGNNQWVF